MSKKDSTKKSAKIERTRDDILEDILFCCSSPSTDADITAKALLTQKQVEEMLSVLVGQGLIEMENKKEEAKYQITPLGRKFLEAARRNNRLSGIVKF
jgi:predicted transcriptional regulator